MKHKKGLIATMIVLCVLALAFVGYRFLHHVQPESLESNAAESQTGQETTEKKKRERR